MSMLKDRQRRERESLPSRLLRNLPHPPLGVSGPVRACPRPILNIGRYFQKLRHKEERQQLRHDLRRRIRKRPRSKPRFEDWLRAHNMQGEAEQWRYRRTLENIAPALREARPLPEGQTGDPRGAYVAHRQTILQNSPDMARSSSTLDALIAMHMREDGFKREDIVEAVRHCAPEAQPKHENRDWQRYAERAASYAFGVPGDLWLDRRAGERKQEQKKREDEVPQQETLREVPKLRFR